MTDASSPPGTSAALALALDLDDSVAALRLAGELKPWFSVAKVGLELYSASGPDVVGALLDIGYDVFCDLKFHDIPTTVGRAARVVGALGATYLNFHAEGGVRMLAAGAEGFLAGASGAGLDEPVPLAVTVLTSHGEAPSHVLQKRVEAALEAGCRGIVCGASEVRQAKQYGPRLITVVPGIRPAGSPTHDQGRAATPEEAVAAGADVLVLGRAITAAADPAAAAATVAAALAR